MKQKPLKTNQDGQQSNNSYLDVVPVHLTTRLTTIDREGEYHERTGYLDFFELLWLLSLLTLAAERWNLNAF
jgi:hypothetical protein